MDAFSEFIKTSWVSTLMNIITALGIIGFLALIIIKDRKIIDHRTGGQPYVLAFRIIHHHKEVLL